MDDTMGISIENRSYAFVGATVLTGHLDAPPIRYAVVLVDDRGRITDSSLGIR